MQIGKLSFFFSALLVPIHLFSQPVAPLRQLDEKRVAGISLVLSDRPSGLGVPYDARAFWDPLMKSGRYDDFLKEMKTFVFPQFSEEAYFSLSKGASSSAYGLEMMRNRMRGLSKLVWAECLENKGNYTPVIEEAIRSVLAQPSWVSPRNDYGFKNYHGKKYSVEITTAMYVHTLAQCLYLMGDKLEPSLRRATVEEMHVRVFDPVLNIINTVDTKSPLNFLTMTNNYNPVCLAGVVGAALTVIPGKKERAAFIHIGEYYARNGLGGFNEDGYCTEGMMYYNYGFKNFLVLRHVIWQATNGQVDLFSDPKIRRIGWYAPKMQVINQVYPAISDCGKHVKPDYEMMYYLNCHLGMGLQDYRKPDKNIKTADLTLNLLSGFAATSAPVKSSQGVDKKMYDPLRSFFESSNVLVVRPHKGSRFHAGAVFKGGDNGEQHNHNDVGTYTIVVNDKIISGDPGSIPYTADIFDKKFRYTYKTIGSYGHPAPLVGGKEQRAGKEAKAVLLGKKFTDDTDEMLVDISSAYEVPALTKLERRFRYERAGKGKISITDTFCFDHPNTYETALITYGKWKKISPDQIELSMGKEKVFVKVKADRPFVLKEEVIDEGGGAYTRIGIRIAGKCVKGNVTLEYSTYE